MGILEKLVEKNEAPILFIGAGISKRYLKDALSWQELLIKIAAQVGWSEERFYRKSSEIKAKLRKSDNNEFEISFIANAKVALELEKEFNSKYYNGEINIDGFSSKKIFDEDLSPMKCFICNIVNGSHLIKEKTEEIEEFKKLLSKARCIISTNYDNLLGMLVSETTEILVEQNKLFLNRDEYGQLMKIHGSVENPKTIVITEEDYKEFDSKSILITSRLISMLLESPIIFLGYGLRDKNIVDIFKNFTQSLFREQLTEFKDRCIFIDYQANQMELLESDFQIDTINTEISLIKTDNYFSLYQQLNRINQGLKPSEVRKFQSFIRDLIVEKGRKGALKAVLISDQDLNMSDTTNYVVAIGNERNIFKLPSRVDYFRSYVELESELNPTIALKFVAGLNKNTYLPIFKFLSNFDLDNSSLQEADIQKIRAREKKNRSFEMNIIAPNGNRRSFPNLDAILNSGETNPSKKIDYITYNINHLNMQQVYDYIVETIRQIHTNDELGKIGTSLGKLLVVYDSIKYGQIKKKKATFDSRE